MLTYTWKEPMALTQRDDYEYGDSQADIRTSLEAYSQELGATAHYYVDVVCSCGCREFQLLLDEAQGVAIRLCEQCDTEHLMGDSEEHMEEAMPEETDCICGGFVFEITVGVTVLKKRPDARWVYIGCRCIECGVTGCYADWQREIQGYQELLKRM